MEEYIINPKGLSEKSQEELAQIVENEFKENGTVAFEHGYRQTMIGGRRLSMVAQEGIHTDKGVVKFQDLKKSELLALVEVVNDYFKYCLYEA